MDGRYDEKLKEELRALCQSRGLPVSGTNPELIARLEQYDREHEDDPLQMFDGDDGAPEGDADGAEQSPADDAVDALRVALDASEPPEAAEDPTERADDTSPSESTPPLRSVQYEFDCGGEDLSTGTHQLFMRQAREKALADGHSPRGGAYRVGFAGDGANRRAVYEILLQRR